MLNSTHQAKFGVDGFGRPTCRRCNKFTYDPQFAIGDRVWVNTTAATLVGFDKSGGVAFVRWGETTPDTSAYDIVPFTLLAPSGKK